MEFRLLGPVEILVAGHWVDAGAPRRRAVLAALLVDAGRTVTPERLVTRVWGEDPPPNARRALHAHLSHIRRLLEGEGAQRPLGYQSGAYLVDIPAAAVDAHVFRQLVADARGPGEDDGHRAQRLRAALRLWRGEPLAGLPGKWASQTRHAWSRLRLEATIAWADAELRTGGARATVEPLSELAAEHPLLEPLAAALMRALHGTGRPASALDHFAALRERLAEELGVEPSTEIQDVHRAILRGETTVKDARPAPVRAGPPVPQKAERTLPADVAGFVGRSDELARLLAWVDTAAAGGAGVAICAVDGMAGVGKTTFAVHAAHRLAGRYPDGQRFVELRAHAAGQGLVEPAAALELLLQADGVAAQQIPAGLDARAGLWRERMAGKRILLVLDDAAEPGHVAPLLPASPGCLVLVTSRRKMTTLSGATLLSLGTLPAADATRLFHRRAGARAQDDPAAVGRVVELCGHLPLAIALTAARLHTHPAWSVRDLADDLSRAVDRLGEMASGEQAVGAAFELSYRDLSPDRQRLFHHLALHPGPDLDCYAAAALDDTTLTAARRGLEDLLEHNLVTEPRRGRFRFHDLIAAHAIGHAAGDPEGDRRAAMDRLLDYYQHTATAAAAREDSRFTPLVAGTPPGAAPDIADAAQATDWFTVEQANLAAAVGHADGRNHPAVIGIPAAVHEHLRRRGPWATALRLDRVAVAAAERIHNRPARARMLVNLAQSQYLIGDYPAAAATAEEAHASHERLVNRRGQADALGILGSVHYMTDDYPAAAAAAHRAGALYRQLGDGDGEANTLHVLARVQYMVNDYPAAVAAAEQARVLHEQAGDSYGEAVALAILALVRHSTGEYPAAAAAAERARDLHGQVGNRHGEATALRVLARVRHATGEYAAATVAAEQARAVHRQVGDRHGEATAWDILARVRHTTGDYPAAAAAADRACALHEQIGNRHGEANAWDILGQVRHAMGEYPAAAAAADRAYAIHQEIDNRLGVAGALRTLGIVEHATGDRSAAASALERALVIFREVADPDGEASTLNHLGRLLLDSDDSEAARRRFGDALDVARRIAAPDHEAGALEGIARCLLRDARQHDDAVGLLRRALAIYRDLCSPRAAEVQSLLDRQPH